MRWAVPVRPSSRPRACWSSAPAGLGAPLLLYLAAAGVGTIGIVDDDVVSLSNLQRQVIHSTPDVGLRKVDSAEAAIERLNPHVKVRNPYDAARTPAMRSI